jgi:8-oxo-dGTP pyrophosphatase MutT (NUDIX family)
MMGEGKMVHRSNVETLFGGYPFHHHQYYLYHVTDRNRHGTARAVRVNGRLKLWKSRPDEFRLPTKEGGMYGHGVDITHSNAHRWLTEDITEHPLLRQTEPPQRGRFDVRPGFRQGELFPGHEHFPEEPPTENQSRPTVAGLAVRAADTGRVLMLQRALNDDDPASGRWEFPGGHQEDGEDLGATAKREWQEEVGHRLPPGKHVGQWTGSNGVYQGFVHEIPEENDINLKKRNHKANPDGDTFEAVAWINPDHIYYHNLRDEILTDSGRIRPLLSSQRRGTDGQQFPSQGIQE